MASAVQTVLLYGFAKDKDSPSSSGFCQKVETFLRVTETPYELRSAFPSSAPKKKLPYIEHDGVTTADSHFIIRHLIDSKISRNLNKTLTRSQLADSRAFQAYIEELVYPCIVRHRWCIDENYNVLTNELFSSVPWPARAILGWSFRRSITNTLWEQGIGRHAEQEIEIILTRAADDLDAKLSNETIHFHGTDEPTEIDVIIFAFLVNALGTESNPFFNQLLLARPNLVAFTKRLTLKLFPEYTKILQKLDGV